MPNTDHNPVERLALLASAIARRGLRVAPAEHGEPAWTDGNVVFIDLQQSARVQLQALAVQASLLSAGSLKRDVVRGLARRPTLARRYLALEGHRALSTVEALLPASARSLLRFDIAALTSSPDTSLSVARSRDSTLEPPACFGTIFPQRVLASLRAAERAQATGARRSQRQGPTVELADSTEADAHDAGFDSPGGGGGALGRWLSKLLTPVRQLRGGGTPGADAPTHRAISGKRGGGSVFSSRFKDVVVSPGRARVLVDVYPEWDVHARCYRPDWCSVLEAEPKPKHGGGGISVPDRMALRRALAPLGLGIDRYHRQAQGDDLDLDALVDARVALLAGSTPEEAIFVDSVRRRRDLSVMLLLDVSGSAGEPAANGRTVHQLQRTAAAALTLALHELGDRVALFAYCSQGRAAVRVTPIKRFCDQPNARALQRLQSLEPGAYSRLGAAIRHGAAVLRREGGTARQLLVVLSDGLAYDHGYEPAYGAADARRALGEARQQGVGCLCLSVGAGTDAATLRRVFGTAAHASLLEPEQLTRIIGPLFRSALRSADLKRRVS